MTSTTYTITQQSLLEKVQPEKKKSILDVTEESKTSKSGVFSDLSEYPTIQRYVELRKKKNEVELAEKFLKEEALNDCLSALIEQGKVTGLVFENDEIRVVIRQVSTKITEKNLHEFPDLFTVIEEAQLEQERIAQDNDIKAQLLQLKIREEGLQTQLRSIERMRSKLLTSERYEELIQEAAQLAAQYSATKTPQLAVEVKGVK